MKIKATDKKTGKVFYPNAIDVFNHVVINDTSMIELSGYIDTISLNLIDIEIIKEKGDL